MRSETEGDPIPKDFTVERERQWQDEPTGTGSYNLWQVRKERQQAFCEPTVRSLMEDIIAQESFVKRSRV